MSSSQSMDKQILGLSVPHITADFLDLASPRAEDLRRSDGGGGGVNKDDIIASYDFQPIRTLGSSPPSGPILGASRPSWGSLDSKASAASNHKYAGNAEPHELTKIYHGKERASYDAATVAEVDRTVKKYADHILHSLDGVSSSLLQMENRTRHLENSVDELKVVVENNNGTTDGKLRQLQNILREVQTGIQVLRDKQEIAETQLQLTMLQTSTGDHQTPEISNNGQMDSRQPPALPQQQSAQQPIQPPMAPPQPSLLPAQSAPNASPPPQQNQVPVQFPGQLPQTQNPALNSYFSSPAQLTDPSYQQYQNPSHQHQPPPPQPYQSAPQLPQYSQSPQPSQPPPSLPPHNPEDSIPYGPPLQSYPPSIRQPSPQQFYGPSPSMYEPSMSRPTSGQLSFSAGYGQQLGPPNFSDPYPYSGSPSHHSSSPMKSSPFSSSAASSGGSNNYQHLPTAQILPQAQQTGSSGGTMGNRVPVDDVVDKVVTMGFSRDQVRATVRKLTENGQSVDLNVVLDKLMNDGEIIQPQKGWFGR